MSLDELIQRLPTLLKEQPELAAKLYEVLKDRFVTNESLKEYIEQGERRFEASDRRFEELLARMDRRFDVSDKQREELRADMNRQFEESRTDMNRQFEESRTDMNRQFEESRTDTNRRFEELLTRMDQRFGAAEKHRKSLEHRTMAIQAGVGTLGRRSGIALERTILSLFRRALALRGFDVEKVEKIGIRDEHGDLFRPGAKVQFDLYIHNGEHFLFEIKYHVAEEDVDLFIAKVQFFEQYKKVRTQKVMIALEIDDYAKRICEDHDIEVITSYQ